jgi:hypothetical protein
MREVIAKAMTTREQPREDVEKNTGGGDEPSNASG